MAIYKVVNIHPQGKPITALNQMIRSDIMGAKLTTDQIRDIIVQKAAVREVLPDGSTVALTLANYADTDLYQKKLEIEREEIAKAKQEEINRAKTNRAIVNKDKAREEALKKLGAASANVASRTLNDSSFRNIVTNESAAANIKDDSVPRVTKVPTIQTGIMGNTENVNYDSAQRDFANKGKAPKRTVRKDDEEAIARARARIEANRAKKK